jgi:tetratricopeptide (TPR) repeat protein
MSEKKGLGGDEDEDLLAEIDQWGDMFDALHESGDDAATGVRDEVATGVREAAPPPVQAAPAPEPAAVAAESPSEVDFSELGIDGPPEALGSLLGTPPPLQPVEEEAARAAEPPRRPSARKLERPAEDEVFTSASRPSVAALPAAPTDDELFGDLLAEVNDDKGMEPVTPRVAMPAAPAVPAPAKAPRTSGAIVRREDLGKKKENEFAGGESTRVADLGELDALNDFDEGPEGGAASTRVASIDEIDAQSRRAARRSSAPPYGGAVRATTPNITRRAPSEPASDFGRDEDDRGHVQPEATRIADSAQLEKLAAEAAAAAQALFDEAPAPELTVDEDFYADFEIGDQAGRDGSVTEAAGDTPSQATPAAGKRTTAHVVRRAGGTLAPPTAEGGVVVEIEAEASDEVQVPVPGPVSGEIEAVAAPEAKEEPAAVPSMVAAEDDFSGLMSSDAALETAPKEEPAAEVPPAGGYEELEPVVATPSIVDGVPRLIAETLSQAVAQAAAAVADEPDVAPELPPAVFAGVEPALVLDAITLPESVDPMSGFDPAEEAARTILVYERELESVDDAALAAALRCEAARLYERLGDADRARFHYEAALLADPRSFTALRGLRKIARAAGDLEEATRHLDAEIGISGTLERRALALHRIDLLMAAGEQDLARVAVGELLDEAKGDIRALLAQLELSFLDGRVHELGESLERLASALADEGLRGALAVALGQLRERPDGDARKAQAAFAAAREASPSSVPALLGLRRTGEPALAVAATAGLAELAATTGDPAAAAGLLLRTAALAAGADLPEVSAGSLERARSLAGRDPLVAEAVHGAACGVPGPAGVAAQIDALGVLSEVAPAHAQRIWALAHEATLRLARGDEGDADAALQALERAAEADPGNDHVTSAHEAQLALRGDWKALAQLALARVAADPAAERDRVTAARALAASEGVDQAIAILEEGRTLAPGSATLADVLADAYAVAGRWTDRVELWTAIAGVDAEQLDPELATVRAAAAAEEAVAALEMARGPDTPDVPADVEGARRATTSALEAWNKVIDADPDSHRGHAAAIAMARRLGDGDILGDALARAQAARGGAGSVTLGLERARAVAAVDLGRADEILAELPGDDPRRLAAELVVAARAGRWADAALFLEERASAASEAGGANEAVALRYRAAQILLDKGDDVPRAAQLLAQVLEDRPQLGAASDAMSAARRRLGDSGTAAAPISMRATMAELGSGSDAFARLVREAEVLAAQGDAHAAIGLLGRAIELRASDPLATAPLVRIARAAGEPAPLTRLALEELKHAEDAGDGKARADAYEVLARVDADMRGDTGSALLAWESAAEADPSRQWVYRQISRAYIVQNRTADLYALRGRQVASLPRPSADPDAPVTDDQADAVALGLDRAALGEREGVSDDELRAIYQDVVDRDRRQRYALFQLEMLVRRGGSSPELAGLELAIADLFGDDPRSRAAFLTRAGETLSEVGNIEAAIDKFRKADEILPGYVPALQGWRHAALRGNLWLDVAEAASREAAATTQSSQRAALYHLAGVVLMDRALAGERAVPVLRKALAAEPSHHDAFVRLRILLDEQGEQEELVRLLEERLVHEEDRVQKIAIHRAAADLYRNFLGDRESAKYNLRAILELEPNDLRAVAALSDIAWEQGAWAEAAEAFVLRARLERDPVVLRNLYYRLGTIYADRLPQPELALQAFQRVLAADPEDPDALERIADLGIATGEWKMALGACERLVKGDQDPDRRVSHLHRVGRIFQEGFGDRQKAERAYRMALDAAPTNDAALTRLVEFYQDAGDLRSVRTHLDRVAMLMRTRLEQHPGDGPAARVIARAMAARQGAGVIGSLEVARAAAELARTLGALGPDDPEQQLANQLVPGDVRPLVRTEADDLLFPRAAPPELRQIFAMLGERVAKHVGVDLRPYGVTRGDRLRARENPVATAAQEVADQLGLGEIDVYVSQKQPLVMQAEPTSPVSLVIGAQFARPDALAAVKFAAGAALKIAQAHLAIVARLGGAELSALTVALLRLFVPDFHYLRVDEEQAAAQLNKLRRLIPSGLLTELRPYALGLDLGHFDHEAFQRAVIAAGLRAGVRASGSLGIGLQILAAQRGLADAEQLTRDPLVKELIAFAVSEDHARLVQLPPP